MDKIRELEEQLSQIPDETENFDQITSILIELSQVLAETDTVRSLEYAAKAILQAERSDSVELEISSLQNAGDIYHKKNKYEAALAIYLRLLAINQRREDREGIGASLIKAGMEFWYLGNYQEAQESFRTVLTIGEELDNKKLIAESQSGKGLVNWKLGNCEKAMENYQTALVLQEELGNSKSIAGICNYMGIIYKLQGKPEKALTSFQRALAIQEKLNDLESMATLLNNMGNLQLYHSRSEEALKCYLRSLSISEKLENNRLIASTTNNVGLIYFNMNDYVQALPYLERALVLKKEIGNRSDIAHSQNNIGLAYHKLGKHDKALKYLQEALAAETETGDRRGIACTLSLIGVTYQEMNEDILAKEYYLKSRELYEVTGDKTGIAAALINEGGIALKQDNFEEAREFLERGLSIAQEINVDARIKDCYHGLMELCKAQGDFEQALSYFEKHIEIRDKISSEESRNQIAEMRTRYEVEKQEKEAEIYRLKNVELVAANNELLKLKDDLEKRVAESITEIRKKDSLLIAQSRQAAMGEMISFIAHQWRQPLNTINIIAQNTLDSYNYKELTEEKMESATEIIMEQTQFMSETIDDFRNFFHPDKVKVTFSIKDVIQRTIRFIEKSYLINNIEIKLELAEDCRITGFPNEYAQVVLNILNNARDAFRKNIETTDKQVFIKLFQESGKCIISIKDTAGGVPEEVLPKIFDAYYTTKADEKSSGLGLYMSKTIIEEHIGGRLIARNVPKGMEFRIET
ncbi:MAG: tetratricopeptide repeat-containing sensor histidine kinase [Candidatus Cloacimonetes bacterium]|nr:tetratricopeptide repeat-containing sensor histidine kinase [Candidatus Cloacimonadota bacterium]